VSAPNSFRNELSIRDSGFEVFPDVLSAVEVDTILHSVSAVTRTRAGARHLMGEPEVARIAHDPRLLQLASAALGAPATPYRATLFDKSPRANWLVVWHQDTALPLNDRRDVAGWGPWSTKAGVLYAHAPADALRHVMALRVHLDDSTTENGPLRVIPGSHELGVLSDAAIQDLVHAEQPAECVVGRGGIVAMCPLLVHSSSKSVTPAPRRVLHFEYASSMTFDLGLTLRVA
jgi:ectoine hydroxylase-related dioxygenase (phytanoyl-CoA dioxygenase family)